jgi:hypothetical protein
MSGYNTNGWPCTKVSMLYSLHVEHFFLLISQNVTAHCSGRKRFYFVSTPYSPCVSSDSHKWLPRLQVPHLFQCIFYILLNFFSSWICMQY